MVAAGKPKWLVRKMSVLRDSGSWKRIRAQMLGIALAGVVAIERDGLIADDAGRAVGRGRIDPMGIHVRFGAGDEERSGQMQPMKSAEINIATIHDVDGACLREQQIERVNVVEL